MLKKLLDFMFPTLEEELTKLQSTDDPFKDYLYAFVDIEKEILNLRMKKIGYF